MDSGGSGTSAIATDRPIPYSIHINQTTPQMTQGRKEDNCPGGIYIVAARCPYFEEATGMMKIKIGLAYKGREGTKKRAMDHKTSCPDDLQIMALFAVDENTSIPAPAHTIGGVHEMERYLHSVMVAYGWAHIGQGTEWFAVPTDLVSDPTLCPELQQVLTSAPAFSEVRCFQRIGQNKSSLSRTPNQKRLDRGA